MKKGALAKNILYLILIAILFLSGYFIIDKMNSEAEMTFTYNLGLFTFVKILFYGGIGVVLGVDNFLKELSIKGKWKIDIVKLIIIGIPSLMCAMQYLVAYIIPEIIYIDGTLSTIACVVLGYTLISSIKKEK